MKGSKLIWGKGARRGGLIGQASALPRPPEMVACQPPGMKSQGASIPFSEPPTLRRLT